MNLKSDGAAAYNQAGLDSTTCSRETGALWYPPVTQPQPPGVPAGLEGIRQVFRLLHTAFPDLQIDIEDLIAEGDKVVGRVMARGTHQGEFMGIAPTGKAVSFNAIDVVRIAGGKIVERWSQVDNLALLQQLGAVPPPGQTAAAR